jgi:hypothetical protein
MKKTSGAYIVSWSFEGGRDKGVVVVGEQIKGDMNVINAFQGEEAAQLIEMLETKKEE